MGMVFYEVIGPDGEVLAEAAANAVGAAVGLDPEGGVTFDSDDHDERELQEEIERALAEANEEWASHLQPAE